MTYKLTKTSLNPDPYYGAVSLLLSGDGANNSTDIRDSSRNTKVVTAVGDAKISTAQSKFGGASLSFASVTDYLITAPNQDYVFGTGDFTIEFWLYLIGNQTSRGVLGNREYVASDAFWQILFYTTQNRLEWHTGLTILLTAGSTLSTSTWNHIAFARQGSTLRLFIDGNLSGSATDSFNYSANNNLVINRDLNPYASYQGATSFMDDIRITKGIARYNSNFTPPTQPFLPTFKVGADPEFYNTSLLLHGDGANSSQTITDSSFSPKTVTASGNAQISTAQSKFGGSSLAFDGNGDYLGIADSTDFDIGLSSNPFTIEAWVRPSAFGSLNAVFNKGGGFGGWNGTNGHQYILFYYNSTDLYFQWWNGSSFSSINSTGALATNVWAFLAVVYDGTDVKVYKDGTLLMTGSSAVFAKPSASNIVRVGGNIAGGGEWNGYIDDLRITRGVARSISIPTAPFPNF